MPSSIFLSQSIRTFPPSVSSFSFMPCSFPYFNISFLSFFLASLNASLFIPVPLFLPFQDFPFCFPVKFPSFLCHHFLISPYKTVAGPYEALKRLKAYLPCLISFLSRQEAPRDCYEPFSLSFSDESFQA